MTLLSAASTLRRCLAVAVVVGLVPAATATASTVSSRDSAPPTGPATAGWVQPLGPAGQPAYHVLNGVVERSASDVMTVGVGGPIGGEGRAWQWDGHSWTSTHPPCNNQCGLTAITRISETDMWAVGDDHGGALPVALHWDGHRWTRATLPTPAPDSADRLTAVSASGPDDVWASGYTVSGFEMVISPLIEHYDGTRWSKVDSVMPAQQALLMGIVSIGPDDAWAVGSGPQVGIMEHWDGHEWQQSAKGLDVHDGLLNLTSITALGSDDVWAAGGKVVPAGGAALGRFPRLRSAVVHWDGTRWHTVRPLYTTEANNFLMGIAVTADDDIWVVGGSYGPNKFIGDHTLTEHYDGHTWRILDAPNPGDGVNTLNAVTTGPGGDAWAVGESSSNDQRTNQTVAIHWDGHRWRNQPIRPQH